MFTPLYIMSENILNDTYEGVRLDPNLLTGVVRGTIESMIAHKRKAMLLTSDRPLLASGEYMRQFFEKAKKYSDRLEAKASSAGTFDEALSEIYAAQNILIAATPKELVPELISQTKDKLDALYNKIRRACYDGSAALKETAGLKQEEIDTLFDMINAQKRLLLEIEKVHEAATLAKDARVILDVNLMPSTKRIEIKRRIDAIQRILETPVEGRAGDAKKARTGVVLLQDLGESPQFDKENDIIISDREIAKGVKHFIVDRGISEDNALFVTPYLIAYARGLISINSENYDKLIGKLDGLYMMIAKSSMPDELRDMLKNPSWTIANIIVQMIPDVKALGEEYIERLQRQTWAALVAA